MFALDDTGRHSGQLLDVGVEQFLKHSVLSDDPRGAENCHFEGAVWNDDLLFVKVSSLHWELTEQLCLHSKEEEEN